MIFPAILSATLTFTATATGVEKGTSIEFFFAGPNSDRAYESMFVLDEQIDSLCRRIDSSVPRGSPVNVSDCRLWPTGCRVRFEPSFESFVKTDFPNASFGVSVYTGGSRLKNGTPEAVDEMPAAFFSTYSLAQSPIVFSEPLDQGTVYGRFSAAVKLEKGKKYSFSMFIDEHSMPFKIELTAEKGNLSEMIRNLRMASVSNDLDVSVSFSDNLTVNQAEAFSRALSVVDSSRIKINGKRGELFYRAFLPLEKWRDRQERLHQPFELSLRADGSDQLLFIDEDWTVEGNDPKLTPQSISYEQAQASRYSKTDTCFIYVSKTQSVFRVKRAMKKLTKTSIRNWYIFSEE